jgi:hypothetical protein
LWDFFTKHIVLRSSRFPAFSGKCPMRDRLLTHLRDEGGRESRHQQKAHFLFIVSHVTAHRVSVVNLFNRMPTHRGFLTLPRVAVFGLIAAVTEQEAKSACGLRSRKVHMAKFCPFASAASRLDSDCGLRFMLAASNIYSNSATCKGTWT